MKVEIDKDKRGDWRWRVMAGNNRIVATGGGDGYRRRCDMLKMMRAVLHPALLPSAKALLLAGAIGLLAGCASTPRMPWTGYGPVNRWPDVPGFELARTCAAKSVAAVHIEFFCWAPDGNPSRYYENPDDLEAPFRSLVRACKLTNRILFVSVCNDNKGSGKYGDDRRGLSEFRPQISKALGWIKDCDWDGLYVQPVGETRTSAGAQIEAEAAGMFPASRLVRNTGSRPTSGGGWAAQFAYHAARLGDTVPRGAWAVTDHSTILNELGGLYAQNYDPARVEAYAKRMLAQGSPCIIYGFGQSNIDKGSIEALGRAVKAAGLD